MARSLARTVANRVTPLRAILRATESEILSGFLAALLTKVSRRCRISVCTDTLGHTFTDTLHK